MFVLVSLFSKPIPRAVVIATRTDSKREPCANEAKKCTQGVLTIKPRIPEISVKCQMEQSFSGNSVRKILSIFTITPDFTIGTEFLYHFTDSPVCRLYFVRNRVMRGGKAWEPSSDSRSQIPSFLVAGERGGKKGGLALEETRDLAHMSRQ